MIETLATWPVTLFASAAYVAGVVACWFISARPRIERLKATIRRYERSTPLTPAVGEYGDLYAVANQTNGAPRLFYVRPAELADARYATLADAGVFAIVSRWDDDQAREITQHVLPGEAQWADLLHDRAGDLVYYTVLNLPVLDPDNFDAINDVKVEVPA